MDHLQNVYIDNAKCTTKNRVKEKVCAHLDNTMCDRSGNTRHRHTQVGTVARGCVGIWHMVCPHVGVSVCGALVHLHVAA